MTFHGELNPHSPPADFGPCCICEATNGTRNLLMLHKKSPMPGRGWGCFVCGLPRDGAMAVVCDPCFDELQKLTSDQSILQRLKFACRGFPSTDGRVPISELAGRHDHDMRFHPEIARERN